MSDQAKRAYEAYESHFLAGSRGRLPWAELSERVKEGWRAAAAHLVSDIEEIRIAELEDALDHIRAVCRTPELMSFTIDLQYVGDVANRALKDAQAWSDRPTRRKTV
jgi:hypothetical protein